MGLISIVFSTGCLSPGVVRLTNKPFGDNQLAPAVTIKPHRESLCGPRRALRGTRRDCFLEIDILFTRNQHDFVVLI